MVIVTSASQDNFRAFGFSRGQEVTWKQVEKAFRRRSVEVHPDRGGDEEEFKRLQAAHELVKKLYQMAPVTAATHATFLVLDIDAMYEQIPWSTVQENFDGKLKFYVAFFGGGPEQARDGGPGGLQPAVRPLQELLGGAGTPPRRDG